MEFKKDQMETFDGHVFLFSFFLISAKCLGEISFNCAAEVPLSSSLKKGRSPFNIHLSIADLNQGY